MNAAQLLLRLNQRPRARRVFLFAAFLVPVLLVLPHARSLVVRNAVNTAYLGEIEAPITGQIVTIQLPAGRVSRAGEPAMTLHNSRVSRGAPAREGFSLPARTIAAKRPIAAG